MASWLRVEIEASRRRWQQQSVRILLRKDRAPVTSRSTILGFNRCHCLRLYDLRMILSRKSNLRALLLVTVPQEVILLSVFKYIINHEVHVRVHFEVRVHRCSSLTCVYVSVLNLVLVLKLPFHLVLSNDGLECRFSDWIRTCRLIIRVILCFAKFDPSILQKLLETLVFTLIVQSHSCTAIGCSSTRLFLSVIVFIMLTDNKLTWKGDAHARHF